MKVFQSRAAVTALLFFAPLLSAQAVSTGDAAPAFTLEALDGTKVSLADLKGKVVYLDFWASWCGPCRHSLPFLNKLADQHAADGLVVLAVNIDSERVNAEKALSALSAKFTVLLDPEGSLPEMYDAPKMPSSFLIDRDGSIRNIHPGFDTSEESSIEEMVKTALQGNR